VLHYLHYRDHITLETVLHYLHYRGHITLETVRHVGPVTVQTHLHGDWWSRLWQLSDKSCCSNYKLDVMKLQ